MMLMLELLPIAIFSYPCRCSYSSRQNKESSDPNIALIFYAPSHKFSDLQGNGSSPIQIGGDSLHLHHLFAAINRSDLLINSDQ